MNVTEVYPCGTSVTTVVGSMSGMITCVSERFGKVQYEITYMDGGEFKTVWMNEYEFKTDAGEKKKIGYK